MKEGVMKRTNPKFQSDPSILSAIHRPLKVRNGEKFSKIFMLGNERGVMKRTNPKFQSDPSILSVIHRPLKVRNGEKFSKIFMLGNERGGHETYQSKVSE
ncbi:hypothetical protein ACFE04_019436 [Oxalis oulophora]